MASRRITGYDEWRAARFFPGLQGLRAVAALLVVFHHARTHWMWGWLEGWNGVTIFFVLSGFLITTLALREEEKLGALRWGAFFVRRVFRILPVYLICLFLYAAVMVVLGMGASHRASFMHAVPWYLSPFPEVPFFTRTHIVFSLAWSLGIEEKFYLLWPLLAFVLLRRRARGRLGVAVALALALQLPIAATGGGRALAPYTAILVGCVLAFLMQNRKSFASVSKLGSTPGFLTAVALLATVHALTHVWRPTTSAFRVDSPFYYLPYSLAAALVVAAVVLRAGGSQPLESSGMQLVGKVSYPLYLIHPIALGFAAVAVKPGGIVSETAYLAVGLALAIAISYGIHRIVEEPLIAMGKRLANRVSPPTAEPLGAPALAPAVV
jgi:peptidoglycan/LPS O-acetylase OafA/YrhL